MTFSCLHKNNCTHHGGNGNAKGGGLLVSDIGGSLDLNVTLDDNVVGKCAIFILRDITNSALVFQRVNNP